MYSKKAKINIGYLLIGLAVGSIALFAYQVRTATLLKSELRDKERELKQLQETKERIKEIEDQLKASKLREEEIFRRVPRDKETVFDLLKELTSLANRRGLKDIVFTIEGYGMIRGEDTQGAGSKKRGRSKKSTTATEAMAKIRPYYFTMSFTAGYKEVILFLEEILELTRIVSVEQLEIERSQALLPRQTITLRLATYSFSGT